MKSTLQWTSHQQSYRFVKYVSIRGLHYTQFEPREQSSEGEGKQFWILAAHSCKKSHPSGT